MLAFAVTRSAVSLCRPVQQCVGGGREMAGRLAARGAGWKRLASGEVRTVRAIPVEGGGVRARLSGELTLYLSSRFSALYSALEHPLVHAHVCCNWWMFECLSGL